MKDIYEVCPSVCGEVICLKPTERKDANALLDCYSDEQAVLLFNSDNCNGDDFHYTSLARMEEAIAFWQRSYAAHDFVRWSVFLNDCCIGTIELFNRYGHGLLRVDLNSQYEREDIFADILHLVQQHLLVYFQSTSIVTKVCPVKEGDLRRKVLQEEEFVKADSTVIEMPYYYIWQSKQ